MNRRRLDFKRATTLLCSIFLGLSAFATTAQASPENLDFDQQGGDDYVVYRRSPLEGFWFIFDFGPSAMVRQFQWGLAADVPVPGDYYDSSHPDLAVYRKSTGIWYIRKWNEALTFSDTAQIQWGGFGGDIPVPCDYIRSGEMDLGIYRNGLWYILSTDDPNKQETKVYQWGGIAGDRPVPKDYDGDGKCDLAVYRQGTYFVRFSSNNYTTSGSVAVGTATDIPMPSFFDDDNRADFAVFRPGTPGRWIIQYSTTQRLTSFSVPYGVAGDIPLAGNINGNSRSDITVWRPSTGTWFYAPTPGSGDPAVYSFGLPSAFGVDVPLAITRDPASYL